jgi:hypothetical protein
MSNPTRVRDRAAIDSAPVNSPAPENSEKDPKPRPARRPPLASRLPDMSDERLLSLQQAATRISLDAEHPKRGSATTALPLIDAEIGRRAAGLAEPGSRPSSVKGAL